MPGPVLPGHQLPTQVDICSLLLTSPGVQGSLCPQPERSPLVPSTLPQACSWRPRGHLPTWHFLAPLAHVLLLPRLCPHFLMHPWDHAASQPGHQEAAQLLCTSEPSADPQAFPYSLQDPAKLRPRGPQGPLCAASGCPGPASSKALCTVWTLGGRQGHAATVK